MSRAHSRDALIPGETYQPPVLDRNIQHWREEGSYLPDFMRDFHDQKDLFKALHDVVERANAKNGGHRSLSASWADYHVYTVDIFLWVMAGHGYTLQRSRQKFDFPSIYAFVSAARERARAASARMLSAVFAASQPGTSAASEPNPTPTGSKP